MYCFLNKEHNLKVYGEKTKLCTIAKRPEIVKEK